MNWPEWIACQRYCIPEAQPIGTRHAAILAELNPGYLRPDDVEITVEKVVLTLRWYWPIVPQEWHGGVRYDAAFSPVAGYYCPTCRATFFEATPELLMTHDCNVEVLRKMQC
jgi:hypothetical protein